MEKKCQICGKVMNLIPAGVSKKTGKPYQAFYACPDKCVQPRSTSPKTYPAPQFQAAKPVDWDKVNEKKSDGIRENVALKMVSELISAGKIDLKDWEKWTNTFCSYMPKKAGQIFESFPIEEMGDDGFPTEGIPF